MQPRLNARWVDLLVILVAMMAALVCPRWDRYGPGACVIRADAHVASSAISVATLSAGQVLETGADPAGVVPGSLRQVPIEVLVRSLIDVLDAAPQATEPAHVYKVAYEVPTTDGKAQVAGDGQQRIRHPEPLLPPVTAGNVKPAMLANGDLADFEKLPAARRHLIDTALAVARDSPWLPYVYGGADPARGGLDCSGAMYFVMNRAGLAPPRTSAGQYLWLRDHQRLRSIPSAATTTGHPSLAWLQPGDLLFWATDPPAATPKSVNITHVAMYLGRETKDGLQVMINATDGRAYRGTLANGYGVYDFRMPRAESISKLVGYGTPPGLAEIGRDSSP